MPAGSIKHRDMARLIGVFCGLHDHHIASFRDVVLGRRAFALVGFEYFLESVFGKKVFVVFRIPGLGNRETACIESLP
jgi:hypothetical protein